MKTTNPLGRLFGPNPFTSLQEHMRIVVECADTLQPLFEAVAAEDADAVERYKDQIFDLEDRADQIHKDLRNHLPSTFLLPVGRRDLLDLLQRQDDVADVAQDIAGLLYERQMTIPDPLKDDVKKYVAECVDVVRHAATIIEELDELLEMGFGGKQADSVNDMIEELHRIETGSDRTGMLLARALFRIEDDLNPVSAVFWYRLIEWIGDVADNAESVGNRIRLLIAR